MLVLAFVTYFASVIRGVDSHDFISNECVIVIIAIRAVLLTYDTPMTCGDVSTLLAVLVKTGRLLYDDNVGCGKEFNAQVDRDDGKEYSHNDRLASVLVHIGSHALERQQLRLDHLP